MCGGSGLMGWKRRRQKKANTLRFLKKTLLIFPSVSFFFYFCVKNHAGLKMRKTHKKYWVPFTKENIYR